MRTLLLLLPLLPLLAACGEKEPTPAKPSPAPLPEIRYYTVGEG